MDRVVAQGYFGVLVAKEIKQKEVEIKEVFHRARIRPKIIDDVTSGKAELHRPTEVKKLITVLFLAGTKRRERAFRLFLIFFPSFRMVKRMRYNNRGICRRGKIR